MRRKFAADLGARFVAITPQIQDGKLRRLHRRACPHLVNNDGTDSGINSAEEEIPSKFFGALRQKSAIFSEKVMH